jgi:uncharacterized phiE125 gp8 family phage protein
MYPQYTELKTVFYSAVDQIEVAVITPAKSLPVELDFIKNYAKIETDKDDELIDRLIRSAVEQVEVYCSRSLMPKTLKANFFGTEHWKALPIIPVKEITEVKTVLQSGVEKIHAATDYEVIGGIEDTQVHAPVFMSLSGGRAIDHVEITYTAGYASTDIIPQVILESIWLLVTLSYQQRDLLAGQCITIASNSALRQKLFDYRKPYI